MRDNTYPSISIKISALAFFAAPALFAFNANAAPTISCTRGVSFGQFIPSCNGTIIAKASSASGTANNGCHSAVGGVIQPAKCTISTTLSTAANSVKVSFTGTSISFSNTSASGLVTLDSYRIEKPTAGQSVVGSFTFSTALINNTHKFNVGARLNFNGTELPGVYNSNFKVGFTTI